MDDLSNITDSSNPLPLVTKGKCVGCNETAKDSEVLHCYLCKNYFHAVNCTVRDTLGNDALPSVTNLTNYTKFGSKTYSTGTFIWTCFRCGVVKELSSPENIGQRVAILESLLMTLSPALLAVTKSQGIVNEQDVNKAISDMRACTPGDRNENPTVAAAVKSSQSHAAVTTSLFPNDDDPSLTQTDSSSPLSNVSNSLSGSNTNTLPTVLKEDAVNYHPAAKSAGGAKIKFRVTSKNDSIPLRTHLHRAHSAGIIGNYSMRYHSNSQADLLFDNLSDAETAHQCVSSELEDLKVGSLTCMKTKMVHIVGLTEDDTKDSVYKAICKPGRNHRIEHLVNPYTLRVLSINPCNGKPHVYRASVVISEDIWGIILNKMNSKLKIDYLSCSVFLRPDSIRCYRCQRLGHTSQSCKNDVTCVVCGEGHNSKDCKNAPKCINCAELDLDSCHRADSLNCAAYKNFRKGPAKNSVMSTT